MGQHRRQGVTSPDLPGLSILATKFSKKIYKKNGFRIYSISTGQPHETIYAKNHLLDPLLAYSRTLIFGKFAESGHDAHNFRWQLNRLVFYPKGKLLDDTESIPRITNSLKTSYSSLKTSYTNTKSMLEIHAQ